MEPITHFFYLIVTLLQVGVAEPRIMTIPMASMAECAVVAEDLANSLRDNAATADVGFLCVSTVLKQNGVPKA